MPCLCQHRVQYNHGMGIELVQRAPETRSLRPTLTPVTYYNIHTCMYLAFVSDSTPLCGNVLAVCVNCPDLYIVHHDHNFSLPMHVHEPLR